jgi:hypothetical protein
MSDLMRSFVAGQIKYARDITWFLAPYINSYKRFQVGTFAPTKTVWSRDNRTAGFRLCGEGGKAIRIECRIGGADLNPYLAFAGLIAAGLAGVEEKLALDPPFSGDAYFGKTLPEVPKTLREATQCLAESKLLRQTFGDAVVEHYVHTAKWEQFEWSALRSTQPTRRCLAGPPDVTRLRPVPLAADQRQTSRCQDAQVLFQRLAQSHQGGAVPRGGRAAVRAGPDRRAHRRPVQVPVPRGQPQRQGAGDRRR